MARTNDDVERALLEYADLLAIVAADPFKPRAYEKAARAVGAHPEDLAELDGPRIRAIPGVGASIAQKIETFLRSGSFPELEELRAQVPAGVREMTRIAGVGPKKAMAVYRELGIADLDGLVAAAEEGRLASLKGFSQKTQEQILRGAARARAGEGRVRIDVALGVAEDLLSRIEGLPGVQEVAFAGSLRRMAETIGDVDLLVAASEAAPIMEAFTSFDPVARILAKGETKSSIVTRDGLQVDLRVIPRASWGAAMIYFTGSKAHNVRIREIAVRRGLKLNEYGLFDASTGALLAARTERAVYERLGLSFVEPTLREDLGEVEAALEGSLPRIVTARDIRGDLHTHTDLTDGRAPLEAMLDAALARGYAYVAVTDHAPDLAMHRMTDEKMLAQRERIRALQARYPAMALLHGTELNIGPDGTVDWDGDFLAGFDLTVASIHSHFRQSRAEMTRRVIRAMENPHVHVIGHLTTRLIGRREPVDLDLEAVFAAAARTGTALEIDAYPDRLDLRDEHVRRAARHGVRFSIDSDAHAVGHLDHLRYGIGVAQRAWLHPTQVINTWPLAKLRRFLRKAG